MMVGDVVICPEVALAGWVPRVGQAELDLSIIIPAPLTGRGRDVQGVGTEYARKGPR